MKKLLILLLFGFIHSVYAQKYTGLEKVLQKELSTSSTKDGRWVFYAKRASIEKLDKVQIKKYFPEYDVFKMELTNYLGYHVNQANCIVLYDSLKSAIIKVDPLWYGGISDTLIKLCINKKFDNKDSLLNFMKAIHELMVIDSGYSFVNTGCTEKNISYDLMSAKGNTYTITNFNGGSSVTQNLKEGAWRKTTIVIDDLKIKKYTSINPVTSDKEEVK
jgi:hypothetical protein